MLRQQKIRRLNYTKGTAKKVAGSEIIANNVANHLENRSKNRAGFSSARNALVKVAGTALARIAKVAENNVLKRDMNRARTAKGNAADSTANETVATLTVAGTSKMLRSASTAISKTRTASTAAR